MNAKKSNQQATVNRVTLLESVAAARNQVVSLVGFHRIPLSIWSDIYTAAYCLKNAEIEAAAIEAWGDGP